MRAGSHARGLAFCILHSALADLGKQRKKDPPVRITPMDFIARVAARGDLDRAPASSIQSGRAMPED
jgi:hypothetical protein